jgi:hypothetical protein
MLLLSLFYFSACDDTNAGTGQDGGVGDLATGSADLTAIPQDLSGYDATCALQKFQGFPGTSPSLRRLDCPCGCVIDPFETTLIAGYWNGSVQDTTFNPTVTGLAVTPSPPDGGAAFASLTSINPSDPFFLDGDFDLLVDYQLLTTLPNDSHATLEVNNLKPPTNSTYSIERQRSTGGVEQYQAAVAGIQPVSQATAATSGTLELKRTGFTLAALADGTEVTRFTGAVQDRLAILLSAGLGDCTGAGCSFTVKWHNLRLVTGSLVDRQ